MIFFSYGSVYQRHKKLFPKLLTYNPRRVDMPLKSISQSSKVYEEKQIFQYIVQYKSISCVNQSSFCLFIRMEFIFEAKISSPFFSLFDLQPYKFITHRS